MKQDAKNVANAWRSVTDEWIVRRNKAHANRQWEVVHDWGGDVVGDKTMALIGRFATQDAAEKLANECDDLARGTAVLRALGKS